MIFADVLANVELGSVVAVSDGTMQPTDNVGAARWRSRNCTGALVEKSSEQIVVQLEADEDGNQPVFVYPASTPCTFTVPDPDLALAQILAWEATKAYRDQLRYGGCDTPKGRMQSDPDSRDLVNGAISTADKMEERGMTFSVNWTMADNTVMPHNRVEITDAGLAISKWYSVMQDAGTWVRGMIDAATTVEDVQAIDVEALFDMAVASAYPS